jgi:hypothetical protein
LWLPGETPASVQLVAVEGDEGVGQVPPAGSPSRLTKYLTAPDAGALTADQLTVADSPPPVAPEIVGALRLPTCPLALPLLGWLQYAQAATVVPSTAASRTAMMRPRRPRMFTVLLMSARSRCR